MGTIKLTIPNMRSSHCQMTVTNTVQSLGAKVKNIAPMQAEIELPENLSKEEVISAIEKVGYKISNQLMTN